MERRALQIRMMEYNEGNQIHMGQGVQEWTK